MGKLFGDRIADSLRSFNRKLKSGDEIRGVRVSVKGGKVVREVDAVIIKGRKPTTKKAKRKAKP